MKFKRFVVLILACTVLGIPSTSKAIEQEDSKVTRKVVCYEEIKEENKELIKKYRKAAEKGDAEAQYSLGMYLTLGKAMGVERNLEEAAKWYSKAAEQGYVAAYKSLGDCYKLGRGVEKNLEEAVKWYSKAADHGYPFAQYELITCYLAKGTKADYNEALKWYKILSENENNNAITKKEFKDLEKRIKKEGIYLETTAYRNDITYTNLVRHPSDYENQRVNFYGKVLEVYEDSDCVNLVIATNISDYSCILCCEYDPSIATTRILEDDYVTVFGISVGLVGEMTKYPGIYVERIEIGNYSSHKK